VCRPARSRTTARASAQACRSGSMAPSRRRSLSSIPTTAKGAAKSDRARRGLETGAHLPARAPAGLALPPVRFLPDGSYPAELYPSADDRRRGRGGLLLRVVEFHRQGNRSHHFFIILVDSLCSLDYRGMGGISFWLAAFRFCVLVEGQRSCASHLQDGHGPPSP
jgi:hypothetical protein